MIFKLFGNRKKAISAQGHSFVAVGYPKVGNTWLRMTLGRYVEKLANLPELPLFEPNDAADLKKAIGPQATGYFTHAPLEWDTQVADDLSFENTVRPFLHQKVILLTRHPLDALLSLHKQQLYRTGHDQSWDGPAAFLEDRVFGLEKFIKFYELWFQSRHAVAGLLLWRYENAKANPEDYFRKTVSFLDLPIKEEAVTDAVRFASFDSMKKMEMSQTGPSYRTSGFGIFATGDRSNPDAFHVRKGKVGGFRDELTPDEVARFEAVIKERLPSFYEYSYES
jgi:hypothetical protein